MTNRAPALVAVLLLGITGGLLGLSASASGAAASASAAKKPSPSPSPSTAPSGTFVKAYAALAGGAQLNLSPLDVQATSDGGDIALAETESAAGLGVDWLVKLSAAGAPQWQEEVGCAGPQGAPGDYADGVSVQQTADGGYVVAGGTIDCGSGSSCPPLSGRSCALVEKLDSAGKLTWARVYQAGPDGSALQQIRQTADGGYIAAGSFTDASQDTGALLLKLDSAGNVQWQRNLGPSGSTQAYFTSVRQTSDGGYVAAGDDYTPTASPASTLVLVAQFSATGSLTWQHGFTTPGSSTTPTSATHTDAIIQTSDGGYAIAGNWTDPTFNGADPAGALLLKLDASGTLQWQRAYSGGVYCFFNGFSETCANIGATGESVHQTTDGGYVLAGDGNLEMSDGAPIEAWQAKVDATGNLVWQHLYYQVYPPTGRPLGEFFPAAAPAPGGGFLAIGPTLDYPAQKDLLFAARTDSSGLAGTSCPDVHSATPLQAINPGLAAVVPSLPLGTATTPDASSPIGTVATSISTQQDC